MKKNFLPRVVATLALAFALSARADVSLPAIFSDHMVLQRDIRVPAFPDRTEAARLASAVNLMADRTQQTEARLRQFAADASHELRTPLTTLRGYAALHAAGGLRDSAAVDDAMRRINSEATRMATLVEDLLLLAELDEQRPFERVPVRLRVTVDGRVIHERSYAAKGLANDGPSLALERFPLPAGRHKAVVELADTVGPTWTHRWQGDVELLAGQDRVLLFDTKAGFTLHGAHR